MAERLENLADYIGPYVKEAISPIKPTVHTFVEALRNGFPQLLEAANWRATRSESYINKARVVRPTALTRFLAFFSGQATNASPVAYSF